MITKFATAQGIKTVFDGSNTDDLNDFRPGMKALGELGVQSPLELCGFSKAEIREGCKYFGLDIWDKPPVACLLSRIPPNTMITDKLLKQIEQAERVFFDNDFCAVRVRHHGEIARVELARNERKKLFDEKLLDYLSKKLKKIGFRYVAFEFEGYVTGNMNPEAI